jgi:predicted DNA-binding transcriptional regulator AlpA
MAVSIGRINNYIQRRMQLENLEEVPLSTAAKWLHEENILKDSSSSPGNSLRRHVYKGNIFGAYQKSNYFWFIKKIKNYDEILTVNELAQILGLKSRTGLYRKITYDNIPFKRKKRTGIYFLTSDLLRWAMEENRPDILKKIQKWFGKIQKTKISG